MRKRGWGCLGMHDETRRNTTDDGRQTLKAPSWERARQAVTVWAGHGHCYSEARRLWLAQPTLGPRVLRNDGGDPAGQIHEDHTAVAFHR